MHISALDSDETRDNRNIDYSIEAGNINSTFQITSDTGEILLVKSIDREEISMFTLKVLAMDRGSPARNATADVVIHVDDVNDNPPVFNQTFYEVKVSEAQMVGAALVRVTATDKDYDENAKLSYDITSGNDLDCFEVNPTTGVVSLKKPLDFDKNSEHRFIVRATDGHKVHPGKALSAIATVAIKVEDENDNSPVFPVPSYLEFVAENAPVGTTVFTAHANDMDRGLYGKLNYSISGGEDKDSFKINSATGAVITDMVFDYEARNRYNIQLQASDVGGQTAFVQVQIEIESRDEFAPEFTEMSYRFSMPSDADAGYVIGKVMATDRDKGADGRVVYHLRNQHPHFKINKMNGVISVRKRLADHAVNFGGKRRRRRMAKMLSSQVLTGNSFSLVVVATSGRPGSLSNMSVVEIVVEGAANGTRLASADQNGGGLADWAMGLLIALIFLVLGFVAALVFLHMRHRKQPHSLGTAAGGGTSKAPMSVGSASDPFDSASQFDTLAFPPQYNEIPNYEHTERRHHVNTSEMSEQSHSASSGRGSAEEGEPEAEEDEEIRMINEGPLRHQQQQAKLQRLGLPGINTNIPDSGIHGDDDNLSDVSVHNTQEYLARLGIDSSRTDPGMGCVVGSDGSHISHSHSHSHVSHPLHHLHGGGHSIASMHLFEDDGPGDGDGMDLSNLIYAKLNDVSGEVDPETVLDGQCNFGFGDSSQPSMTGSLSSIVHSEEELTGSYNWDYLLDWGPQYQPLAHVFGEIARLKDDSAPNSFGTSTPNKRPLNAQVKTLPPPLITNVAPRSIAPVALNTLLPVRGSGQLAPVPSLPRSPINHEGSFTTAMSPSFSPSLSPLANRSPSISPLVPPGVVGGPKMVHHSRPPRSAAAAATVMMAGVSSGSETELRL